MGVAHQQDVGAELEGREIAGPMEALALVAARGIVGLVERVLVGDER
jgi:hypothetical protein